MISNANRSIEVFKLLNDTIETLYSLETGTVLQSCMPVGFAFFTKEFTRYAEEALTNPEVAQILRELCEAIEPVTVKENTVCYRQARRSIVDPDIIKMTGPRTTSTSPKVDRRAPVQRRKMVEDFQVNILDQKKKPSVTKRQHKCSICNKTGHHPQTCSDLFAPENSARADLFFKRLIEKDGTRKYLAKLTKRESPEFLQLASERIALLTAGLKGAENETTACHSCSQVNDNCKP